MLKYCQNALYETNICFTKICELIHVSWQSKDENDIIFLLLFYNII